MTHIRHYLLRSFIIAGLILFPTCTQAQTHKIDSLKAFLLTYTTEDTIRVNAMQEITKAYLMDLNDKEKMGEWAVKMLALSSKLKYKKGSGWSYMALGTVQWGKSNFENALSYYFRALKLFEEVDYKRGMGSCYSNIGNVKNNQGKYQEAVQFGLKGAGYYKTANDKKGEANVYNNMGFAYTNLGNFQKALQLHFRSLRMREQINDRFGIASSYINIGNIFGDLNRHKEDRDYQLKALEIKKEVGDKEGQAIVYNNLANSYMFEKKYTDALAYHLKSLKLREPLGDKQGIATTYLNIGHTYFPQDKVNEALSYYLKAAKLSEEVGDKAGMINSYNGIGTCYEKKKNYEAANSYYLKALKEAKETNYKLGLRDSYNYLSSVNEKLGNCTQALSYTKLYSNLKDTLLNEDGIKQAGELSARYETDKKEKEILLLTKDQQLKAKTLKEQRLVRIGLIIGLVLFLTLSFLLFNRYRIKQKANLLLEKQKQEIHQKNTQITDSIDYAKTIQEAILPDDKKLTAFFPEHFILYKPKDIVSGDFYWIGKKDDKIICAVADCTGHGVPGAFMSLLGHTILENVIQRDIDVDPGVMITALNEEIVLRFSKGQEHETVKHGMDIAVISIDNLKGELQYAGAKNSLYIVRENLLTETKADNISTGIVSKDHTTVNYTNNKIALQKGDMLYLFSDGFPDQKGGPEKKKFFYQPFKDLLTSISHLPVEQQKEQLHATIAKWIGNGEQIDDILVMGIRI